MESVTLVAITGVRAGSGRKRPGDVFAASAEIAAELLASGAARPAEEDDGRLDQIPTKEEAALFERPA